MSTRYLATKYIQLKSKHFHAIVQKDCLWREKTNGPINNLFDICPAQYLDIHINNKNQNYHYFLFEFYSPKLPKSNVSPENILYIETNLFVVSQKSRQHSTRGRQGGDQGRRGDKPTRGLWELTDDIGEWCWWTMSDGKCILIAIIIY